LRGVQEVAVTDHAIARYRERVKPGLSFEQAERELLHVLGFALVVEVTPAWAQGHGHDRLVGWAVLGDGIAFPLVRQPDGQVVAATCVTRGGCAEDEVERRRRGKAMRRHDRRHNVDRHRSTRRRRWEAA
jgi:hypothetical protein